MATVPLSQIPTLTQLYHLNKLHPHSSPSSTSTSRYNNQISLIRTDITKLAISAIVNAANESLLGGGGVDGAIHRAAGPQLLAECETLHGCATGEAKITGAYRLPCERVIHTVGPVYWTRRAEGTQEVLLKSCYTRSLDLASENGCASVAFSALSTGVYGYPSGEAARAAIEAVKGWLEDDEERAKKIDRIIFCNFMEKDELAYQELIPYFFPPSASTSELESKSDSVQQQAIDESNEKVEEDDSEPPLPDLPDVPTEEPTEEGQSQPKRAKLSSDDNDAAGEKL